MLWGPDIKTRKNINDAVKMTGGRIGFAKSVLCVHVNQWRFYVRAGPQVLTILSQAPKFSAEANLRANHVLVEDCTLGPGPKFEGLEPLT